MNVTLHKIIDTMSLASELMHKHGLLEKGWRFELDNAKRRIGSCDHTNKTITYSKQFLDENDEIIRDTILHEIAHALVGSNHGHDRVWQNMAINVGADPTRLTETITTPKYNFLIKCENENCPRKPKWKRYRLKRSVWAGATCPVCHGELSYYRYR